VLHFSLTISAGIGSLSVPEPASTPAAAEASFVQLREFAPLPETVAEAKAEIRQLVLQVQETVRSRIQQAPERVRALADRVEDLLDRIERRSRPASTEMASARLDSVFAAFESLI
jgi:hypothetical protein